MKKLILIIIIIIMIITSFCYIYADEYEEILNTGIYYPVVLSEYYPYWLVADRGNNLVFVGGNAPFFLQNGLITIYKDIHQSDASKINFYRLFYQEGEWVNVEVSGGSYNLVALHLGNYVVVSNHNIINEDDGSVYFYDNYQASPMPTPTPSDRDYTGLFGQVIEAIDGLVSGIGDYILNGLQYLFVPEFDFEENIDNIKSKIENKFGSVIQIYNNIMNNIEQIEAKRFEGIKIDLSQFVVPINTELYILEPGPINYYASNLRAWISGIMIFFTVIYVMKKVLQIIRGTSPL